jgi:hypothetical protein
MLPSEQSLPFTRNCPVAAVTLNCRRDAHPRGNQPENPRKSVNFDSKIAATNTLNCRRRALPRGSSQPKALPKRQLFYWKLETDKHLFSIYASHITLLQQRQQWCLLR